jgi:hypothetical protein
MLFGTMITGMPSALRRLRGAIGAALACVVSAGLQDHGADALGNHAIHSLKHPLGGVAVDAGIDHLDV